MYNSTLKNIPPVNSILERPEIKGLVAEFSRDLVVDSVRLILGEVRKRVASATDGDIDVSILTLSRLVIESVRSKIPQTHERVINATGIILHTNLGRSPLAEEAIQQVVDVARGYSTLEIDKDTGRRSSRYRHIRSVVCCLTGAADALVVNNNAAAVMLALDTMADGKEVIVSRSQLVEIGGAFRMPEIMAKSGAALVEVGTTNRTYISDYRNSVTDNTGLILIVHPSNFHISGFTATPDVTEIVALGREMEIPVLYDIGSGAMVDPGLNGVNALSARIPRHASRNSFSEPLVNDAVDAGVDIITFSTDKLLGGPQGGLIIGKGEYVERCRVNPLLRAFRVDKMTIAALDATLRLYLNRDRAMDTIPVLTMICAPFEEVVERSEMLQKGIVDAVGDFFMVRTDDGVSEVGGGACSAMSIPTRVMSVSSEHISTDDIARRLRSNDPPVFGRIERDCVLLDLRTVMSDGGDVEILEALKRIADKCNTGKDACVTEVKKALTDNESKIDDSNTGFQPVHSR